MLVNTEHQHVCMHDSQLNSRHINVCNVYSVLHILSTYLPMYLYQSMYICIYVHTTYLMLVYMCYVQYIRMYILQVITERRNYSSVILKGKST